MRRAVGPRGQARRTAPAGCVCRGARQPIDRPRRTGIPRRRTRTRRARAVVRLVRGPAPATKLPGAPPPGHTLPPLLRSLALRCRPPPLDGWAAFAGGARQVVLEVEQQRGVPVRPERRGGRREVERVERLLAAEVH